MDNIDDFAKWTGSNWFALGEKFDNLTPLDGHDLHVMTLGLPEEVGEVLAVIKREVRDGNLDKEKLIKELGDSLHYWTMICNYYGLKPSDIIDTNIVKINDRRARGTLRGSGDNR